MRTKVAGNVRLVVKAPFGPKKITARMCTGGAREEDVDLLYDLAGNIGGRTVCPMGYSTTWPVQSYINKFRDEVEANAKANTCGMKSYDERLIEK